MPIDYKNYPINWRDIIRPTILKRDNYKCVVCGVSNRSLFVWDAGTRVIIDDKFTLEYYKSKGFKVKKIQLSIAHSCDNTLCENYDHLSSKCQLHHLNTDLALHIINRKITAASKAGNKIVAPLLVNKDCIVKVDQLLQ